MTSKIPINQDRLINGDEKEFKSLFDLLYVGMVQQATFYTNDFAVAEDVVQEVFVRLWEKRGELKSVQNLEGYLLLSVKNRCLNYLEHQQVVDKYKQYYLLQEIQDDDEDFRITETKEIIKAYFQKTYKDTFGIIQMNQNFFDSLININEIFILGHSLSSVDMDYFVEIRKRVLHSCKWYISYFSESDLDNMEYFAKRLDIKNFQPVMLSNL